MKIEGTTKSSEYRWSLASSVLCAALLSVTGCGDDDPETESETLAVSTDPNGPLYVIGALVSDAESSNGYLRIVNDVDLGGQEINLDEAWEFPGLADITTHQGSVLVASGDEPTVTRYDVNDQLELVDVGQVAFASFGLASAAFWNNKFVSEDLAYMVNASAELIVWNPTAMSVEGTIALPELEERSGLIVRAGLSDRSSIVYNGKYYLPLYWSDANFALRSDDSRIVVVDVASGQVENTLTVPCPGLDYGTVDDDGMLHFSNWTGGVGTYWVLDTAQNCIATLDPDTEEVTTTTFASIANGHEGAAFRYAGDNTFVMSVFDEVRANVESAVEPFSPIAGPNWRLWTYDASTGASTPIDDIDWNSGAAIHQEVDSELYAMVPGADYSDTQIYALGDDSDATPAFGTTGWSFRLYRLR